MVGHDTFFNHTICNSIGFFLNHYQQLMVNLEQRLQRINTLIDWLEGYLLLSPIDAHKEYPALDRIVQQAHVYNPWFIEPFNRSALSDFSDWLKNTMFQGILAQDNISTKQIAILTLPNVPLSGAREAFLLYLAGHRVIMRNNDHKADLLQCLTQPLVVGNGIQEGFQWVNSFPRDIDGWVIFDQPGQDVIHQYFNKRKSLFLPVKKQSVVLNGAENEEELNNIADNIFIYWGFSESNIRKLYVPMGYSFNRFFEAMEKYSFVYQYNCYANNYDYHKSVFLMNCIPFLDNGFIILREDASTNVPIGCLHYEFYNAPEEERELKRLFTESSEHSQQNNSRLLMRFIKSF